MISQGTLLWPKTPFTFKNESNRMIHIHCGQSFWVTNTKLDQETTKIIKIARSNSKVSYNFKIEDVRALFDWSAG
jgi:hypothetical protein